MFACTLLIYDQCSITQITVCNAHSEIPKCSSKKLMVIAFDKAEVNFFVDLSLIAYDLLRICWPAFNQCSYILPFLIALPTRGRPPPSLASLCPRCLSSEYSSDKVKHSKFRSVSSKQLCTGRGAIMPLVKDLLRFGSIVWKNTNEGVKVLPLPALCFTHFCGGEFNTADRSLSLFEYWAPGAKKLTLFSWWESEKRQEPY